MGLQNEILSVAASLKEVGNEIGDINIKSDFERLIDDIGLWTQFLESFSSKIG